MCQLPFLSLRIVKHFTYQPAFVRRIISSMRDLQFWIRKLKNRHITKSNDWSPNGRLSSPPRTAVTFTFFGKCRCCLDEGVEHTVSTAWKVTSVYRLAISTLQSPAPHLTGWEVMSLCINGGNSADIKQEWNSEITYPICKTWAPLRR